MAQPETEQWDAAQPQVRQQPALIRSHAVQIVLLAAAVDSAGTGLYLAISTLYLTRVLGYSAGAVGGALSAASVGAFMLLPIIGRMADRHGSGELLTRAYLARGIGYCCYLWAGSLWQFCLLSWILFTLDRASTPLQQGLVDELFPPAKRSAVMALMRTVKNGAIGIGFFTAGIPLAINSPAAYRSVIALDVGSFLVSAVLVRRLVRTTGCGRAAGTRLRRGREPRDMTLIVLTVANSVLLSHNTVLTVVLPLWIVQRTHASVFAVSLVLTLNTCLGVLLQIPVGRLTLSRAAAARSLGVTGGLLAVAFISYGLSASTTMTSTLILLGVGMAFHAAGECLQAAAGWQLTFELAPAHRRNEYFAKFNLGRVAQDVAGPVTLVFLVMAMGPWGWVAMAGLMVLTGCAAWALLREERAGPWVSAAVARPPGR